jgi:putative transposase
MKPYRGALADASAKLNPTAALNLSLEATLPLPELLDGIRDDIEAMSAEIGLTIIGALLRQEVAQKLGARGQQRAYRHGQQAGYVVYGGRKVSLSRPRVRQRGGGELALESYRAFQSDGRMQRAVARQLIRQCSTRNYAGAIDDCLHGYGTARSSVSRHWQAATEVELQKLLQRPVPADLVALVLDGKHFGDDCIIVALGVDRAGRKHVLGLWHGASENATVVKALLADLIERGLSTERGLLVVIDGAKALRKAVGDVWGRRALVQRCRVHKQRNVIEHLPKGKQQQAIWRLRAAWAKADAREAERELRSVVRWLDEISPMAARSLEEGLEETLTLQRLGLNELLARSLSSTNLIESCFSRTAEWTRRVRRWRSAKMVLRWSAAALLVAEAGFRRVRGYRHMHQLEAALHNYELALQKEAA